jgi:hypothetical protein
MHLHVKSSSQDLIAELTLPEFLVFYHMSIAVTIREIDVEIFDWLRDLLLNASFFLLNFDDAAMGCPVSLNVF